MLKDQDGKQLEVGDKVFFKEDIEGYGYILSVIQRRGYMGTTTTFVLGNDPKNPDSYPWHPMARMSTEHLAKVVYTDRVWKA